MLCMAGIRILSGGGHVSHPLLAREPSFHTPHTPLSHPTLSLKYTDPIPSSTSPTIPHNTISPAKRSQGGDYCPPPQPEKNSDHWGGEGRWGGGGGKGHSFRSDIKKCPHVLYSFADPQLPQFDMSKSPNKNEFSGEGVGGGGVKKHTPGGFDTARNTC